MKMSNVKKICDSLKKGKRIHPHDHTQMQARTHAKEKINNEKNIYGARQKMKMNITYFSAKMFTPLYIKMQD